MAMWKWLTSIISTVLFSFTVMFTAQAVEPWILMPQLQESSLSPGWYFLEDSTLRPWGRSQPTYTQSIIPACSGQRANDCIAEFEIEYEGNTFRLTPGPQLTPISALVKQGEGYFDPIPPNSDFPSLWKTQSSESELSNYEFFVTAVTSGTPFQFSVSALKGSKSCLNQGFPYEELKCVDVYQLPTSLEIKLEVNLKDYAQYVSNWASAGVIDPRVSIVQKDGFVRLIMSGKPIKKTVLKSSMTAEQARNTFYGSASRDGFDIWIFQSANGKYLAESISAFLLDTSQLEFNSWSFVLSYKYYNGLAPSHCFDEPGTDIGGYVSTNASAYSGLPPTWDETSKVLDYQIIAPHFLSNGNLNTGYFYMTLSNEIAKCLWGLDPSKAKVSVSITNTDGSSQVATTEIKTLKDRLEIKATGFHYSSPNFQLKLQPIETQPKAAKKSTVMCIKGKVIKKVSGINPKCPAGYKKR